MGTRGGEHKKQRESLTVTLYTKCIHTKRGKCYQFYSHLSVPFLAFFFILLILEPYMVSDKQNAVLSQI